MIDKEIKTVLIRIAKILNKNNIDWVLMGTVNHKLQGMNKKPNDIDILTKLKDLKKVRKLFSHHTPSKIKKIRPGYFEFKFKINKVPIEIIGEEAAHQYFKNRKEFIVTKELKGIKIYCRRLEKEIEVYKQLGRKKKAEEIRKACKN